MWLEWKTLSSTSSILLARFHRDFLEHDLYREDFLEAYENFCTDVTAWQDHHGVYFQIELTTEYSKLYDTQVTTVRGVFQDQTDLALYRMVMDSEVPVATSVTHINDQWQFSEWRLIPET